MVKEPQGVLELMEQTDAAWQAEIAACDDVTAPERVSLREALGGLRREYAEADYPRREAIQGELRALIRRYEALSGGGGAVAVEAEAGAPVEAPVEAEPASEAVPEPTGGDAPHAPVPLGVEAGAAPAPARAASAETRAPEPPPEAPRAPQAPSPHAGARRPEAAPRVTGPVPHGAFRPAPAPEGGAGPEMNEAQADTANEGRDADREDGGGPSDRWEGAWGSARGSVRRWMALARLAVEHEVLLRKRETRFAELGVRVWQLGRRDALGDAAGDAGVRERLRQVEQVEAAIRANRDRRDDLRGPG